MKAPKEGSRKAAVYAVFHEQGLEAAIKHGVGLELKAGTIKSWAGGWGGKPRAAPAQAPAGGGTQRAAANAGEWALHFKHASRAAAERHMMDIVRRNRMDVKAFHIIEYDGRFAVAAAHIQNPNGPPQFDKGDTVFDTTIPNKVGKVVGPGAEVSDVKYEEGVRSVPNYYLHKFDGPTPDDKPAKKKRVRVEEAKAPAKKAVVKKPVKPIKKGKK